MGIFFIWKNATKNQTTQFHLSSFVCCINPSWPDSRVSNTTSQRKNWRYKGSQKNNECICGTFHAGGRLNNMNMNMNMGLLHQMAWEKGVFPLSTKFHIEHQGGTPALCSIRWWGGTPPFKTELEWGTPCHLTPFGGGD